MEITKKDLLLIINILSSKIESSFLEKKIIIDDEKLYWEIPEDQLFDVFNGEPNLVIGDLTDDWEELLRLKDNSETPLSYDLKRLTNVLQLIRRLSRNTW